MTEEKKAKSNISSADKELTNMIEQYEKVDKHIATIDKISCWPNLGNLTKLIAGPIMPLLTSAITKLLQLQTNGPTP